MAIRPEEITSAIKKPRPELSAVLNDPAKLSAAAAYHRIPVEWARFWLNEEINRNDRRN